MGVWGADVEALDVLAARFADAADHLEAGRTATTNAVQVAAWRGADAESFRGQWGQHARAMDAAARALRQAADDLRRDAREQRQASAVEAGSPRADIPWGGWGRPMPWAPWMQRWSIEEPSPGLDFGSILRGVDGFADLLRDAVGGLDMVDTLTKGVDSLGSYTEAWQSLIDNTGRFGDLLRFQDSPVLQQLGRIPELRAIGNLADSIPVKSLSAASGVLGVGGGLWDMGRGMLNGDAGAAAIGASDAASAALKMSPNPVLYLAGANVSIWTDVARNADDFVGAIKEWQPLPSPFDGNSFRDVYLQSAKDVGAELWGSFKKAFF